jgi:hypothetical protein
MNNIQQHKINAVLSKQFRYDFGIATRKEAMNYFFKNGYIVEESKYRNYIAEYKIENWLSKNAFNIPWGNEKNPATIAYNAKKTELKNGIFKTVYKCKKENENSFYEITKIEFDYFISLSNN